MNNDLNYINNQKEIIVLIVEKADTYIKIVKIL